MFRVLVFYCANLLLLLVHADTSVDSGLSSDDHSSTPVHHIAEPNIDLSSSFENSSSQSVSEREIVLIAPANEEPENCTLTTRLIESMNEVYTCVSENSTPASYCTECKKQFHAWRHLLDLVQNSTSCSKLLQDDSSVATSPTLLGRVVNETVSYWIDSRCQMCEEMNQTELSEFRKLDTELNKCLSDVNQTCADCLPLYKDLSQAFTDASTGSVCVELKDRLNRTQYSWNNKGCKPPKPDIATAMILSGFFALLPAIFYTYLRIFGAKRTRKLLRAGDKPPTVAAAAAAAGSAVTATNSVPAQQALLSETQSQ